MRSRLPGALAAALTITLAAVALAQNGAIELPTGWAIRPAPGPVAIVGTLPEGIVVSRDGAHIFELESGYRAPALRVLDATTLHEISALPLAGAFGVPLRDADGDGVWLNVAGASPEQIVHVEASGGRIDRAVPLPAPFYPVALARSVDGTLAVAGDLADRVAFVDPRTARVVASTAVGTHPAALAFSGDGKTLYVAERGASQVDVVDVATRTLRAPISVGLHPSALAIDARRLYVADSDDDDVAIVDLDRNAVTARARLPFARPEAVGASPNALALDGGRLYVSCGAANAIAVYRVTGDGLVALGAVATGWYPTAIALDAAHGALYVADGKGESSRPNGTIAGPARYIANQLVGSIRRLPIPDDAALARGLDDVQSLAQHAARGAGAVVRANGPIRHVLYVIRENRSYDQIFGDVTGADGDPSLVMFGADVTPNAHQLARRFGVFDRFFEDAHVSADGHNWSTAAFANDYVEHMWPPAYADRRDRYDFEDGAVAARPHAGYLWTDAATHGVSLRNYGEFVSAPPGGVTPVSAADNVLRERTDPNFPGFDMNVRDADRYTEWKREFDAYERTRTLPQLEIIRLPRDHTSGTAPGKATPQAMVADNDAALGELVDAVSHAKDWTSTAIFVIEDDAQNGPDHVDEQRAPFLLISPYASGGIRHTRYTQASVLRTIELILGLPPMSAYDAGALPMNDAFGAVPNPAPFAAVPPRIDLGAKNRSTAYRAAQSARLDFAQADRVDPATMNDILWHAVKGEHASPPPFGRFAR